MPIHAEPVAWMSGRFDVLSTAMILWAATCYVWSRRKRTNGSYSLVFVLIALSIFSKETGFVLPVLLVAAEILVFRTKPGWIMTGYFALAGLMFAYRFHALGGLGGYKPGGVSSALDISPKTFEGLLIRSPSQMLTGLNWTQPGTTILIVASLLASVLLLAAICAEPDISRWAIVKLALFWSVITVVPAHFLSERWHSDAAGTSRGRSEGPKPSKNCLGFAFCVVQSRSVAQSVGLAMDLTTRKNYFGGGDPNGAIAGAANAVCLLESPGYGPRRFFLYYTERKSSDGL